MVNRLKIKYNIKHKGEMKMIDFNNSKFVKLKPIDANQIIKTVGDLLIDGEQIVYSFQAMRDSVVFTDKRVISINVQGLTGTKKRFHFTAIQ